MKLVVIGDVGVGKTSLLERVCNDRYDPEYTLSTLGAAFSYLKYEDHRLDIWDTAGQERYRSLVPMYIRGADIVWIVIDPDALTDRENYFKRWVGLLDRLPGNAVVCKVLTKCDTLLPDDRKIPGDTMYHTSALTGIGIVNLMRGTFEKLPMMTNRDSSFVLFETPATAAPDSTVNCC